MVRKIILTEEEMAELYRERAEEERIGYLQSIEVESDEDDN